MDHNVTDLNSRRGRRESVSDADIDAVIEQLMEDLGGVLPSGEAVYATLGSARTRCFARLKYWQRQGEAQRLENPGQLPIAVIDGLQLVMTRLEQDVQARINHHHTEWELERTDLHSNIANAHKRELAEIYKREDLEKQLAALEHRLVASQTENTRLWEINSELQRQVEQHKAQADANKQIADVRGGELEAARSAISQLQTAVEQYRVSYAGLQEEWGQQQKDYALLQANHHEAVATLRELRQSHENSQEHNRYQARLIVTFQEREEAEQQERLALEAKLNQLQEQLVAIPDTVNAQTETRLDGLFQTFWRKLEPVQLPSRAYAYSRVMRNILAQAELTPEDFGVVQGSVQRLQWVAGTEQDIDLVIGTLQAMSGEKIKPAQESFPSVEAFYAAVSHSEVSARP